MFIVDPAASWTISIALALVFGASAAIKFAEFGEFRAAVENYRIVPESFAASVAAIVPIAELAGAGGILIPRSHEAAAALLLILLAVFTLAIVANLMRGRLHVDCGCFGPSELSRAKMWLDLGRDIVLLLAASLVYLQPSHSES